MAISANEKLLSIEKKGPTLTKMEDKIYERTVQWKIKNLETKEKKQLEKKAQETKGLTFRPKLHSSKSPV